MAQDPDAKVDIIIPTAINLVLLVNENVMANLRRRLSSSIELPSLYKRAFMAVGETDEIAVIRQGNV
jgi:hypothetical protein